MRHHSIYPASPVVEETPIHASPVQHEFAERLERHVERSVCGRVIGFRVDFVDGTVVLHGRCRTYHAKQLVLQAALDVVDGIFSHGLVNQIVVC